MKFFAIFSVLTVMLFASAPALAMFTGDTKAACEAVLCLSSGKRPGACMPAIRRYFSIRLTKFSDTLKARKKFLNLCPSSTEDPKMATLIDAITNGADRCDYAALNSNLIVWNGYGEGCSYISNEIPTYCKNYHDNAYTDTKAPRYVGVPEHGGYWIEAEKYNSALTEYNSSIKSNIIGHGGYKHLNCNKWAPATESRAEIGIPPL